MDSHRIIAFTCMGFLFAIAMQLTARELEADMQNMSGDEPLVQNQTKHTIWVDGEPVSTVDPAERRGTRKVTFREALDDAEAIQRRRDVRTGTTSEFKTYETAELEPRLRGEVR